MAHNNLLMLHGALGAASQLAPLAARLADRFNVHVIDFEGHGDRFGDRPFRMEHFADNVIEYLNEKGIEQIDVFGYSMGGYVAAWLARHRPVRVGAICTLGTKWNWTPEIAAREVRLLDAEKIAQKVPAFAAQLRDRHRELPWTTVLERTAEMMTSLGERNALAPEDFGAIEHRIRVAVGDRDTTVSAEETAAIFRLLKNGELEVMPATPHPFEKVPEERLMGTLIEFFG